MVGLATEQIAATVKLLIYLDSNILATFGICMCCLTKST